MSDREEIADVLARYGRALDDRRFEDAGLWTCIPGPAGGLSARSFITRRHHSDPGHAKCWSVVAMP